MTRNKGLTPWWAITQSSLSFSPSPLAIAPRSLGTEDISDVQQVEHRHVVANHLRPVAFTLHCVEEVSQLAIPASVNIETKTIFGNMTPPAKLGQGIISSHARNCSSPVMKGGSLPSRFIQNGLPCSTKILNSKVFQFSTCIFQMKTQQALKTT